MKRWIWYSLVTAIFLAAAGMMLFPIGNSIFNDKTETSQLDLDSLVDSPPTFYYGYMIDSMQTVHGVVKRNQYLSEILMQYNISGDIIHDLSIRAKGVFDIRKLGARKHYDLICRKDSLSTAVAMIYFPNEIDYVIFHVSDSAFVTSGSKKLIIKERTTSGIISNSLAVTIDNLGLSPQLTNDLADIFAWEIDFFRLYPGDKFKVIYDEQVVDDEPIGLGIIKAAVFQHESHDTYAFNYNKDNSQDYFNEEGHSLRKTLLKYPVKFSRISSRYSGRRYHPVQKRYKAHRGTDFAAPQGTPIRSVGDGIIAEARYGKYNGNYVMVKHNSAFSTQYLHMVKIASGIRPGVRVKQGQTIGFVGHTGLAKGNHVCYRFWKQGYQVDALRVSLPPSKPIGIKDMMDFQLLSEEYKTRLDEIPYPVTDTPILSGR